MDQPNIQVVPLKGAAFTPALCWPAPPSYSNTLTLFPSQELRFEIHAQTLSNEQIQLVRDGSEYQLMYWGTLHYKDVFGDAIAPVTAGRSKERKCPKRTPTTASSTTTLLEPSPQSRLSPKAKPPKLSPKSSQVRHNRLRWASSSHVSVTVTNVTSRLRYRDSFKSSYAGLTRVSMLSAASIKELSALSP